MAISINDFAHITRGLAPVRDISDSARVRAEFDRIWRDQSYVHELMAEDAEGERLLDEVHAYTVTESDIPPSLQEQYRACGRRVAQQEAMFRVMESRHATR
ncbi:MAG TPA: hypothetical protein VK973_10510 [Arenicellales bacterium]|nr:hypothetical protein [Arenicellales bacterium]